MPSKKKKGTNWFALSNEIVVHQLRTVKGLNPGVISKVG